MHKEEIEISFAYVSNAGDIGEIWQTLEKEVDVSYFNSWGWISTWLKWLPKSCKPKVITVKDRGNIIGLGIFVRGIQSRKALPLPSRVYFLHETGNMHLDTITVEYNAMLIKNEYGALVVKRTLEYLKTTDKQWDELFIGGILDDSPLASTELIESVGLAHKCKARLPSWHVDLSLINNNEDYLKSLSANMRYQIRKSIRDCAEYGELKLEFARDKDEAQEFLAGLIKLHQERWESKGLPGSFSNEKFLQFHKMLIADRFSHNEIHLLKVYADNIVVGYLYNLVRERKVYFYQSGFNYDLGGKIKPGLICHYLAISKYAGDKMSRYDFLASDTRYKKSLSNECDYLMWNYIQRKRMRFLIEDKVVEMYESAKNKLSQMIS
jgi:hypothetical protein